MNVWLQAKVCDRRLGMWPTLNAGPVYDDSTSEVAYVACSNT